MIEYCRYYKEENTNPWENCFSPVLVWRKRVWEIEKEWIESGCMTAPTDEDQPFLNYCDSKNIPISLARHIVDGIDEKNIALESVIEQYEKYAPLGRDHRMYFSFYLGEEECPYGFDGEEYKRMGWSQECIRTHSETMCDFESKEFQKENRGKEGIWGWFADPKYPRLQKDLLYFIACNWGRWCPYSDIDRLAEQYLNYHYPGEKPQRDEQFYRNAARKAIQSQGLYKGVRKRGVYEGKRVFIPILKAEYKDCPIGLPTVILVDDEGNTDVISDILSFEIIAKLKKRRNG